MLNIPLCKLNKLFVLSLSHNHAVNLVRTFIRDLCLIRDDYSLINNDITKEVLSNIIKFLCIS